MMQPPFIIFGLPRSRTKWLAEWLSYGGQCRVWHDLGAQVGSCQEFIDVLRSSAGTVETGAMIAERLLRHAAPDAKLVTIRRERSDVVASCEAAGVAEWLSDLEIRDACLDRLEAAGAQRVGFADLDNVHCCAWLWEHLLRFPFDFNWWQGLSSRNIQVDLPATLAAQQANAGRLAGLLRELAELEAELDGPLPPRFLTFAVEPIAKVWPQMEPLVQQHHAEARPEAPLAVNVAALAALEAQGVFRILVARVNGTVAGYCTWTIAPDLESLGVQIAYQGAFYVDPAQGGLRIGQKLLERSLTLLRACQIPLVRFHHTQVGRGAKLGALFKRLGAKPADSVYELWIGGPDA